LLTKQEAEGIWRRLHRMTPHTQHAAYTTRAAADLSRVTDTLTDTANIGKNSQHLMHSMQPKYRTFGAIISTNFARFLGFCILDTINKLCSK